MMTKMICGYMVVYILSDVMIDERIHLDEQEH